MTDRCYPVITDYNLYFYIDPYLDWEFLISSELLFVATVVYCVVVVVSVNSKSLKTSAGVTLAIFRMWSAQLLLLPKSERFWRRLFHDRTYCKMCYLYRKSCHVDNLHCWIRYCIH